MKKSRNLLSFLFMHIAFLVYTLYPLLGKFATRYEMLSFQFVALYCVVFAILFLYAILWQQVLKRIPLTTAIANKSITIVWGMIFGLLLFGEGISLKMLIGAVLILSGILILSTEKEKPQEDAA
ncbi:MAG: EamA family transporter [Treponema sp.]|uniref:EamA family transporter n=1 Tax=Treponema sp. TaxID=166 RepID=UPI0025D77759|nr:EamA family transporter [Treponema sp.]MBQ8679096.1 EamA family transporter [Treponema sp.]